MLEKSAIKLFMNNFQFKLLATIGQMHLNSNMMQKPIKTCIKAVLFLQRTFVCVKNTISKQQLRKKWPVFLQNIGWARFDPNTRSKRLKFKKIKNSTFS